MNALLAIALALLPQTVRIERPPSTPFVVHATTPTPGPLRSSAGWPSQSRPVLALQDGTLVSEVSVLVPGGTTAVQLQPGTDAGPSLVDASLAWLARPARVTLTIDGHAFSLSDPTSFVGWHRSGRVHATATMHRTLGQYGAAEWWWDVRADGGIDLALLWHRAAPGPDVRFSSATLRVTGGVWSPVVVPPACAPPYLARPRADGARHVIPQQMGMAWWIHLAGPREVVGVADWSHGGYLPSGFPVAADTPRLPYAARLGEARWRLAANAPTPSWGSPPALGGLWPAAGSYSGGEGGGDGRFMLDGIQWAASAGDADALEFSRIAFLREMARWRFLLATSGQPIDVPTVRTWAYDNAEFLERYGEPGGRADAPFEYDRWPVSWAGDAYEPRRFEPHRTDSMIRAHRTALVLLWLADDPLARLMTRVAATRALLESPPLGPAQPLLGTDAGARDAMRALAMVSARCLGETRYDSWLAAYVAHLRTAQMLSGCLVARIDQYPSDNLPFSNYPGLRLQGGAEFAYHMLALRSIGGAEDVLRGCARGLSLLATDNELGDIGNYYFTATGRYDARYLWEADWPAGLHAEMGRLGDSGYYTAWDLMYELAIALELDAPECDDLLLRTFGTSNRATVRAMVRGWGVIAPSEFTSTPIEQTWPILEALR